MLLEFERTLLAKLKTSSQLDSEGRAVSTLLNNLQCMGSWSCIDAQDLSLSKPCSPEAVAIEAGDTLANLDFSSSIIFEIELAPGADTGMAVPVLDQQAPEAAAIEAGETLANLAFSSSIMFEIELTFTLAPGKGK